VGDGLVDGFSLRKPLVELVGCLQRADLGAIPGADADLGVHVPGAFEQLHLEGARFSLDRHHLGERHDLDVVVEQALSHAVLRRVLPAHEGKHLAHAAVIARKLVVQLGQDAPDGRRGVRHQHAITDLREIERCPDAGNARPNDQHRADGRGLLRPLRLVFDNRDHLYLAISPGR
jgi:hypothetical protein